MAIIVPAPPHHFSFLVRMAVTVPAPLHHHLSFSMNLTSNPQLFLCSKPSSFFFQIRPVKGPIRMGGGPRTYPGGVSKWQWKRMQAKKAKQLLKARLTRERQIYEMRKRAELKAAVSELERPWEPVEKAPKLFSVGADEQMKVLADRFQRPGGFDFWTERDGPELFKTVDGLPSARFFPKGVVHSVKPYGRIAEGRGSQRDDFAGASGMVLGSKSESDAEELGDDIYSSRRMKSGEGILDYLPSISEGESNGEVANVRGANGYERNRSSTRKITSNVANVRGANGYERNRSSTRKITSNVDNLGRKDGGRAVRGRSNGRAMKKMNMKSFRVASELGNSNGNASSSQIGFDRKQRGGSGIRRGEISRISRVQGLRDSNSDVYDMSLQEDGSYGF